MINNISVQQADHITEIVKKTMERNLPLDKAIYYQFKNNGITEEYDRGIIAEVSYELIRWWRLLLEIHNNFPVNQPVNYYQLLATWLVINDIELPKSNQIRNIDKNFIKSQYEILSSFRKIKHSIPDWLDQQGFLAYGSEWEEELKILNSAPPIYIRTNRLKTKPSELSEKLKADGFDNEPVNKVPDALKLTNRTNIFSSKYYKEGLFEVQDAGSQLISMYLDVKPGMRVADMCAGSGGKTLHLASIMQNKGKIIAFDTKEEKIKELKQRLAKSGTDIVETKVIEGTKSTKRYKDSFDRVLIDAPCSGTGSIRRNPEIKWKMNTERLNNLKKIQALLLKNYSELAKSGGLIVYATCSILPDENQEQVKNFIEKSNGRYKFIKEQIILPSKTNFDGYYMAQIIKT